MDAPQRIDDGADGAPVPQSAPAPDPVTRAPRLRAGLLGFGITALIGAFVMGGYALAAATRPQCAGECAVANPASHWAWPTIIAAAALLGWFLLISRTRRAAVREDRLITLTLVVLHVAALLLVWLALSKPWHQLRIALGAGPATAQLPLTIAAVVIGMLGALAVAVGAPAMLLDGARRRRLPILTGCVMAVTVSAVLGGVALHRGDDRRFVDATTAQPVDMPPAPNTFGQNRFRLQIAGTGTSVRADDVISAGAGFVTHDALVVTAYDAAGRERWHYRRNESGAVRIGAVRAFDGGRTLVLAEQPTQGGGPTLVALDAITGERLWSATDSTMNAAMGYAGASGWEGCARENQYLVACEADTWTGFDARTGRRLWRIPRPVRCEQYFDLFETHGRVVAIDACPSPDGEALRMVTVEASTGNVLLDQHLRTVPSNSPDRRTSTRTTRAGDVGAVVTVRNPDGRSHAAYVNVVNGEQVEEGGWSILRSPRDDTGDGFLAVSQQGPRVDTLFGSNGLPRCDFAPNVGPTAGPDYFRIGAAWLGQQLVYPRYDLDAGEQYLQVADLGDCHIVDAQPFGGDVDQLVVANGVALVVTSDHTGRYVDGYAPVQG